GIKHLNKRPFANIRRFSLLNEPTSNLTKLATTPQIQTREPSSRGRCAPEACLSRPGTQLSNTLAFTSEADTLSIVTKLLSQPEKIIEEEIAKLRRYKNVRVPTLSKSNGYHRFRRQDPSGESNLMSETLHSINTECNHQLSEESGALLDTTKILTSSEKLSSLIARRVSRRMNKPTDNLIRVKSLTIARETPHQILLRRRTLQSSLMQKKAATYHEALRVPRSTPFV
ncbi:hypothetical protein Ciccas_009443, partial [Cichlidogyrus casuarinus]